MILIYSNINQNIIDSNINRIIKNSIKIQTEFDNNK